jgi:hypothetical protein
MMLMSSISDVDRCCCKLVKNRSRFRSSKSTCTRMNRGDNLATEDWATLNFPIPDVRLPDARLPNASAGIPSI